MPLYKCHTLGHSEKKPPKNLSGHYYHATFAPQNSINRIMQKKKIVMVAALAIMSAISGKAQQQAWLFNIEVTNQVDDDKTKSRPHRAPVLADVSGTYDASSGTLSLCASFDVACVRIYKDDTLIMEDNHPVTDDGTLYYNLSFYGSGAYRIELEYAETSCFSFLTI